MKIIGNNTVLCPCVATIGSFDGVHQGHRFVIQQVVHHAHKQGLEAVVVTFSNHPLQVLRSDFMPQMLSTEEEKVRLLQQTGIDKVVLVEFTQELSQLTAQAFMRNILKDQIHVQTLFVGYDNHFGHDHKQFADYVQYGKEMGMEVIQTQPFCPKEASDKAVGKVLSSTAIRHALLTGDIVTANELLGYPYALQGCVVRGFQNGRQLGYPTANLQVNPQKLIPENGVYLVQSEVGFGMLNIGTRPTFHNGTQKSIEVHLFDFHGDLYDQMLRIEILCHLRKEKEFDSLEALRTQLAQDEQECRALSPRFHTKTI